MANAYEVLGVSSHAPQDEIRKAYKQYSLELSPNKNQGDPSAAEKLKEIQEAYLQVGDEKARAAYDHSLRSNPSYGQVDKGVQEGITQWANGLSGQYYKEASECSVGVKNSVAEGYADAATQYATGLCLQYVRGGENLSAAMKRAEGEVKNVGMNPAVQNPTGATEDVLHQMKQRPNPAFEEAKQYYSPSSLQSQGSAPTPKPQSKESSFIKDVKSGMSTFGLAGGLLNAAVKGIARNLTSQPVAEPAPANANNAKVAGAPKAAGAAVPTAAVAPTPKPQQSKNPTFTNDFSDAMKYMGGGALPALLYAAFHQLTRDPALKQAEANNPALKQAQAPGSNTVDAQANANNPSVSPPLQPQPPTGAPAATGAPTAGAAVTEENLPQEELAKDAKLDPDQPLQPADAFNPQPQPGGAKLEEEDGQGMFHGPAEVAKGEELETAGRSDTPSWTNGNGDDATDTTTNPFAENSSSVANAGESDNDIEMTTMGTSGASEAADGQSSDVGARPSWIGKAQEDCKEESSATDSDADSAKDSLNSDTTSAGAQLTR